MSKGRTRVVLALVVAALLGGSALAQAPKGRWSAAAGLLQGSGASEPLKGALGYEIEGWYVLSPNWDAGFRLESLSFDSDGMRFAEAPFLQPGSGDVLLAGFGLRWFPMGSERAIFPFVGVAAGIPVSDSFSADRIVEPGVGFVLDTEWEIDSVGYAAEIGLRVDLAGDRWFLDAAARYQVLGATSVGVVEVTPTIRRTRDVDTALDGLQLALLIGRYF